MNRALSFMAWYRGRRNRSAFEEHLDRARSALRNVDYDAAAGHGEMAARSAWFNHPGFFADLALEQVLEQIGQAAIPATSHTGRRTRDDRKVNSVLHVFTEAESLGGHTRLAWRWMQLDSARRHSLVLTRQPSSKLPGSLVAAVESSGGDVRVLAPEDTSLVLRARELRDLSLSFGRIVLHVHPDDVLPSIAYANKQELPSVIFMNHADHLFWQGLSVSDLVVSSRESAVRVCRTRRGIDSERSAILPIPLEPLHRTSARVEAKQKLGIAEDTVVILSIASAYKYRPIGSRSFLDSMVEILRAAPQAICLVVGPEPVDVWRRASDEVEGRLRALGIQQDPTPYMEAADVYVDSFPFGSLTAVLEAGLNSLPLVSYCGHSENAQVLCTDAVGLGDTMLRTTSLAAFRDTVIELAHDRSRRDSVGEATRAEILDVHTGDRWRDAVDHIYAQSVSFAAAKGAPSHSPSRVWEELDTLLVFLHRETIMPRALVSAGRGLGRLLSERKRIVSD